MFDQEVVEAKFPGITSHFTLAVKQYQELFFVCHLNRRLVIACLLQVIQQFTGINAIIYVSGREPHVFPILACFSSPQTQITCSKSVSRL
jgi:Sugar (and other) transporter